MHTYFVQITWKTPFSHSVVFCFFFFFFFFFFFGVGLVGGGGWSGGGAVGWEEGVEGGVGVGGC